jgi:hypothetical protein
MDNSELKKFIIDIIHEEFTPNAAELAPRWDGGVVILKPNNDTQSKEVPIDVFFRKLTGIRDSLRVLEQKINSHPQITLEDKTNFQSYITKAYGSMTTFNILFRDDKDKFVGSGGSTSGSGGGKGSNPKEKISINEAQRRLGLNEYE